MIPQTYTLRIDPIELKILKDHLDGELKKISKLGSTNAFRTADLVNFYRKVEECEKSGASVVDMLGKPIVEHGASDDTRPPIQQSIKETQLPKLKDKVATAANVKVTTENIDDLMGNLPTDALPDDPDAADSQGK